MYCFDRPQKSTRDWSKVTFGQMLEINGDVAEILALGRVPCEQLARLKERIYGGSPLSGEGHLRARIREFGRAAFDAEIARRAAL